MHELKKIPNFVKLLAKIELKNFGKIYVINVLVTLKIEKK